VVEQGTADEDLEVHALRLAAEAPDEAAVEVGPPADAVAVGIGRVGAAQDLFVAHLGERAHPEERDGAAVGAQVDEGLLGDAAAHAREELRLHPAAVHAARDVAAVRVTVGHDQEVAVVRGTTTRDRLLVAGQTGGGVEGRPEAPRDGHAAQRHLTTPRELRALSLGGARHDVAEGREDAGRHGQRL
jgi:hypothetical protein